MKIIQKFEQDQLTAGNIQAFQKKGFFFYDKDKKITLVALGFFDKLNLFLQKVFCCRFGPRLKLKHFTMISNSQLKTLVKKEPTPQPTPVQAPPKEKSTLELAQEQIDKQQYKGALETLEKIKESEPAQKILVQLCKDLILAENGVYAGMAFNKVIDVLVICDLIEELATKYKDFDMVLQFTNQIENVSNIIDIYLRVVKYGGKTAQEAWDMVNAINEKGKDLGEASERLREYIGTGKKGIFDAMDLLSPVKFKI